MTSKTKDRVRNLAMNQVTAIRSVVKKLDFSNDFQAQNKKVGVTTVRRYVKTTDWGKVTTANITKNHVSLFSSY